MSAPGQRPPLGNISRSSRSLNCSPWSYCEGALSPLPHQAWEDSPQIYPTTFSEKSPPHQRPRQNQSGWLENAAILAAHAVISTRHHSTSLRPDRALGEKDVGLGCADTAFRVRSARDAPPHPSALWLHLPGLDRAARRRAGAHPRCEDREAQAAQAGACAHSSAIRLSPARTARRGQARHPGGTLSQGAEAPRSRGRLHCLLSALSDIDAFARRYLVKRGLRRLTRRRPLIIAAPPAQPLESLAAAAVGAADTS